MMKQFLAMRQSARLRGCDLLMFQMGEFFELFWDDAGRASRWLGITQTTRGAHGGRAIPMAGVPLHAAPTHWSRLVRAGRRVAVAEQRGSQPSGATGVVERAVTRILTPGTATDLHTDVGGDGEAPPSFFAVVVPGPAEGDGIGVGWADVSTGQMVVARAAGGWDDVHGLLARHPPSEVVLPAAPDGSASAGALRLASALSRGALAGCDDAVPTWLAEAWLRPSTDEGELWDRLRLRQGAGAHEGTAALSPAELAAAVATVEYAAWTGACGLRGDATDDGVGWAEGRPDTVAAATAAVRDLRSHLEAALVESVPENAGATAGVGALGRSPRVAANRARTAAAAVADVDSGEDDGGSAPSSGAAEAAGRGSWVRRGYCEELERAYALRDGAEDAAAEAERALKSKLGVAGLRVKRVGEGGFFVDVPRRSEEAPLLVAALESGALWRVRTLKSSLRCKSADLVELDKAAAEAAHAVGALEGAVFDRLAERVRGAAWALDAVWAALAVLDVSASHAVAAQELRLRRPVVVGPWEARRRLGVPCGAATSGGQGEGRVEDLGSSLYASGLRHLVVERGLQEGWGLPTSGAATAAGDGEDASAGPEAWKDGGAGSGDASPAPGEAGGTSAKAFVPLVVSMRGRVGTGGAAAPRDGVEAEAVAAADAASPRETALHLEGRQLVVTGPNVAGKSTLLRATAQAAVLAQAGSFVPAESMLLGACDRVFARVGASDDLARERSTFLVEMEEAASFLRHSGPSSLVVVDELGRGTATSDGLAIAAATLHELASPAVDARTLFATHFHQLSELAGECPAEAAPAPAAGGTASEGGASPRWLSAAMAEAGMPLDQLGAGGCACAGSGVRCRSMEVWEGADRDDAVFTFRLVRGGASRSLGIAAAARAGVPGHVVEAAQRLMGRLDERA